MVLDSNEISVRPYLSIHSKHKYAYDAHNTTHIELYIGSISVKKNAHITATYRIRYRSNCSRDAGCIWVACKIIKIYGSCMGRLKK